MFVANISVIDVARAICCCCCCCSNSSDVMHGYAPEVNTQPDALVRFPFNWNTLFSQRSMRSLLHQSLMNNRQVVKPLFSCGWWCCAFKL